jgi:hypothetical protein
MLIQGKCHCGNLSFSLAWEPDPPKFQPALDLLVLHQAMVA